MSIERHRETFTRMLPELEIMALARFRGLGPEAKEEALQNTRAVAWKYWLRLAEKGRRTDETMLRSVWWFAIKQTMSGRTIVRGDGKRGKSKLDAYDRTSGRNIEHIDLSLFVRDTTPIPDQVAFRLDIPRFLDSLNERQQAMASDLASGMTTSEVARKFGVTSGAVSQFRTRFKQLLERYYELT